MRPSMTDSIFRRRPWIVQLIRGVWVEPCKIQQTGSLLRNSKGKHAIIRSNSIWLHMQIRSQGPTQSKTGENLTPRSFFSLAVNFAFGPFFLGAAVDLFDKIPVVAVTFPEKVVSASDTAVLSATGHGRSQLRFTRFDSVFNFQRFHRCDCILFCHGARKCYCIRNGTDILTCTFFSKEERSICRCLQYTLALTILNYNHVYRSILDPNTYLWPIRR